MKVKNGMLAQTSYVKQEYPEKCVHRVFEDEVVKAPQAVALVYEDQRTSYSELNLRADRLAQVLRKLGIGPEVPVGIYLKSSPEAITALLGVMKAGGVFVPLDANQPSERLEYLIRDSQAPVILTNAALKDQLPAGLAKVVCVDSASFQTTGVSSNGVSSANVCADVTPDNAACILYTSGSTGRPKGVVRPHRAIVSRLAWASVETDDVFCHNLSLSVGLSQESLFVALMFGLPLVIVPEDKLTDMSQFVATLEATGVTSVTLVPAFLRQLLSLGPRMGSRLGSVRTVILGGAAFPSDLTQSFMDMMPQAKLFNAYGTTEAGSVIRGQMTGRMASAAGSLGRPLANTKVYILDTNMQLVPDGAAGELYIGAPSLARGYLNLPELTRERFVPNLFGGAVGERLYRTGDLVKSLPNGHIEFLGRTDRQVKVRGFRVELGEIEAVLAQHDSVLEVTVTAAQANGDGRLVAYVVGGRRAAPTASQLHNYLRERLPDYMIPSAFVLMDRFPLTLSGKVDVTALPPAELSRPSLDVKYEAPRDPVETAVAEIWANLLELDRVGIRDHFLDLGGDSLIATRIASRILDRLGVEISLASLFKRPTIAELAAEISSSSPYLKSFPAENVSA